MVEKLNEYINKRDFTKTPEPNSHGGKKGIFVVQEHDARRLHYDFRLEIEGVLKSWAIPKKPSDDPHKKRLAIETEDHPLEYSKFEGIIPEGNYGAGSVKIWDTGKFKNLKQYSIKSAYDKGLIEVFLEGEKLKGNFALIKVKFRNEKEKKNWIFKKMVEETEEKETKRKEIEIEVSNKDKIFFPRDSITKEDVVRYYSKIAPYMLPFIKDRFLSVQRFPDGISKEGFFQKNIPDYYPKDMKSEIYHKTKYIIPRREEDIVYLANQGSIVFHTWQSRYDEPDLPDKVVFDLDPPSNEKISDVVKAAFALKKLLKSLGLKPFLMTTGSRGLHIVVPIKRKETFGEIREFARKVSSLIVNLNPEKYTLETSIPKRGDKVYIDVLRNSSSQLAVAPYSIRAIEGAPVAAPMPWRELNKDFNPKMYNIKNVMRTRNVWLDFYDFSKSIKDANKKIDELLKEL